MLVVVLLAATVIIGLSSVLIALIYLLKYDCFEQINRLEKRVTEIEHVLKD